MKKYLLDTNICVYFLNGEFNLIDKIERVGIEACAVSELTIAELKYGVEKSIKKKKNKQVINIFEKEFNILPIYPAFDIYAKEKARLKTKGQILDDFDLLIGATAIYNNLVMVIRNRKHFERLNNITIEDWTSEIK